MNAPKEHHVAFGLTDYEVTVVQGALQERAEAFPEEAQTCEALETILLDQLGPELPDETGWEVLRGPEGS